MFASHQYSPSLWWRVLHWTACVLGTMLAVLFMMFVIGNNPPLVLMLEPQAWALVLMVAGFLVAWRNDLVGGAMGVAGAATFYLINFDKAGNFPSGWVFPLCFVPGVLAIVAGFIHATNARKQSA
jgi:hypothetical protein